jgi:hypothetical protein
MAGKFAHPLLVDGSMTLGELLRRGRQLRRSEIGRRCIDPIARHAQRFRCERGKSFIRIMRRFDARGVALRRPIAVEAVGGVRKSEAYLCGLAGRELLDQVITARRKPFGDSGRMPKRQFSQTPAEPSHGHAEASGKIRQQQYAMPFALEILQREPARRGLRLSRPPCLDLVLVQQPQRHRHTAILVHETP